MSYRELPPHPRLADFVSCYWTSEHAGSTSYVVLPDGCIDFLFDGNTLEIVGSMTRAIRVEHAGPSAFVGVRFKPGGAVPFLRDRADLMTDRSLELTDPRLKQQLEDAVSNRARLVVLERFLLEQLARIAPIDRRVTLACARLSTDPAQRVEVLARDLALSRQFLRRLFLEHTGLTPRVFARIARLSRTVELLAESSLADAALAAGYADQAHMTREFKSLAGMTPAEWVRR